MSLFLPFNFNPSNNIVGTANYTVPVGSYGFVSANCEDGGAVTFDAGGGDVTVLDSLADDRAIINVSTTAENTNFVLFTFNAARHGVLNFSTNFVATQQVVIKAHGDSGTSSSGLQIDNLGLSNRSWEGGYSMAVRGYSNSATGTVTKYGSGWEKGQDATSAANNFWVQSGTVIKTTGAARYSIALFSIP